MPTEAAIAELRDHVGRGRIDQVRARLAAAPALVTAVGPHPFGGGRPQPLYVAVEAAARR